MISKSKHLPQRTCIACRQIKEKKALIRLVRADNEAVEVDISGKKPGRGAYLCPNKACWEMALKKNRLEHALRTKLSDASCQSFISPKIKKRKPLEAEPVEEIGEEEPVEIPSIPEAPSEKPEEKQIRFAEDILAEALKVKIPDKIKDETKGKRKGKVIKYKKQDEHFIDDGSEA